MIVALQRFLKDCEGLAIAIALKEEWFLLPSRTIFSPIVTSRLASQNDCWQNA